MADSTVVEVQTKSSSDPADNVPPATKPAAGDVQNSASGSESVASIVRRWKMEDMVKRSAVFLRGAAMVLSFLSFVIMASNRHGGGFNFDIYGEYRYLVGMSVLAFLYSALQLGFEIHLIFTGKHLVPKPAGFFLDFFCDQVMAYLLISAGSSAVPLTNSIRLSQDNLFTDMASASITMAFFAFFLLALSSISSGFILCKNTYI